LIGSGPKRSLEPRSAPWPWSFMTAGHTRPLARFPPDYLSPDE
jgi:hypothetical protein